MLRILSSEDKDLSSKSVAKRKGNHNAASSCRVYRGLGILHTFEASLPLHGLEINLSDTSYMHIIQCQSAY